MGRGLLRTASSRIRLTAKAVCLWVLALFSGIYNGQLLGAIAIVDGPCLDRPNVIVILVDDLGVMDTSVAFLCDRDGRPLRHPLNDFYRTPNLERLAKQGMRMSQFCAMSVCSPTRVSLMTGRTSARHRTTNWIDPESNNAGQFGPVNWQWKGLDEKSITLPRLLQAAGYRTIHCGKGHFGPFGSPGADPRNLGFDINIGGSGAGQPGSYFAADKFGNLPGPRGRWGVPHLDRFFGQETFLTEALTQEFNQAITTAVADNQPFFGYFAQYAVHAPFQADPKFVAHYEGQSRELAAFAALVEGVDQSLGSVLQHLESLGVAEQTLVIFLGDNGTDSPRGDAKEIRCAAPLRGKKGTQYEGGMRVPFVISWANPNPEHPLQKKWKLGPNGLIDGFAAVYDLAPTILTATLGSFQGLPQPIDGIDLWPLLTNNTQDSRNDKSRSFLMHYPHEHRSSYFTAFRRGDWKLIYHYRQPVSGRFELFDLAVDPSESKNLAGKESAKLSEMVTAMQQELDSMGALYPVGDDGQTELRPALR